MIKKLFYIKGKRNIQAFLTLFQKTNSSIKEFYPITIKNEPEFAYVYYTGSEIMSNLEIETIFNHKKLKLILKEVTKINPKHKGIHTSSCYSGPNPNPSPIILNIEWETILFPKTLRFKPEHVKDLYSYFR